MAAGDNLDPGGVRAASRALTGGRTFDPAVWYQYATDRGYKPAGYPPETLDWLRSIADLDTAIRNGVRPDPLSALWIDLSPKSKTAVMRILMGERPGYFLQSPKARLLLAMLARSVLEHPAMSPAAMVARLSDLAERARDAGDRRTELGALRQLSQIMALASGDDPRSVTASSACPRCRQRANQRRRRAVARASNLQEQDSAPGVVETRAENDRFQDVPTL